MYHYIINPNTKSSQFYSIEDKLNSKIRQLNIDGDISKTLYEKDTTKITRSAIKQGVQTIVIIGDDKTVNEVVTAIDSTGKTSIAIGFIPIDGGNSFTKLLGITNWEQACEALSSRRLYNFYPIYLNDNPFLNYCKIKPTKSIHIKKATLQLDGENELVTPMHTCEVTNANLHSSDTSSSLLVKITSNIKLGNQKVNKTTNKLEAFNNISQIRARLAVLETKEECIATFDGSTMKDNIFRIRLSQKPIKLIGLFKR
ncbi:MAG: acylglycerol kinase family protein [Candidatus Saccharimonadales bacterium]